MNYFSLIELPKENNWIGVDRLWEKMKYAFQLVVDEYLKHAYPMLMKMKEYLNLNMNMFLIIWFHRFEAMNTSDEVDPIEAAFEHEGINPFVTGNEIYPIRRFVQALTNAGFSVPMLSFNRYNQSG